MWHFTRHFIALGVTLALLPSAATAGLLDQVPVASTTLRGAFASLASCAYEKLDATEGAGIKKIDLPNEIRLALESGGVRYWQLIFRPAGNGTTRVDFTQAETIWGPLGGKNIMPTVASCEAR